MSTDLVVYDGPKKEVPKNLVPFKKGANKHDPRWKAGPGRPHRLNDAEFCDVFAHACAEGLTGKELAELFNVNESSAKKWRRDPRVKAAELKYMEERVLRISRKVDRQIDKRLAEADKMEIDTLLKIRKEYLGGFLRRQAEGGKDDPDTINGALRQIEDNPDLISTLLESLSPDKVQQNG